MLDTRRVLVGTPGTFDPIAKHISNPDVAPFLLLAVKTAPTPLLSNTVLRTDSESKPRCPEQPEAITSSTYNISEQSEVYNFTPF